MTKTFFRKPVGRDIVPRRRSFGVKERTWRCPTEARHETLVLDFSKIRRAQALAIPRFVPLGDTRVSYWLLLPMEGVAVVDFNYDPVNDPDGSTAHLHTVRVALCSQFQSGSDTITLRSLDDHLIRSRWDFDGDRVAMIDGCLCWPPVTSLLAGRLPLQYPPMSQWVPITSRRLLAHFPAGTLTPGRVVHRRMTVPREALLLAHSVNMVR